MSYDLMVFDQAVAPRDRNEFLAWFSEITKWEEDRDYDSPEGMSGNLRDFYDILRLDFPAMNGPDAVDLEAAFIPDKPKGFFSRFLRPAKEKIALEAVDDPMITGYTCASHAIYLDFRWSIAELAYSTTTSAVLRADVGFFDVSSTNGHIIYGADELYARMGL